MRRLLFLAIAALALGLAALAIARLRRTAPRIAAPAAAKDRADRAPAATREAERFVGVVFARHQVDVAATVDARLAEVRVQVGAALAKGDVIATLDAESLRRELQAAQASVRGAQAEAKAARVEHAAAAARVQRLDTFKDAVAGEERINARLAERMADTRIASARARVAEAVARVEQLALLVESSAVVAPFAGVVAARYADPGAQVGPGKPIVRLISADDLWVRFAVPDDRAGEVRLGGCVALHTAAPPIDALGVVESLSPQVDTELRILFAEARLRLPAEPSGRPNAGLAADVRVVACTTP